jgi:hypothetical protein
MLHVELFSQSSNVVWVQLNQEGAYDDGTMKAWSKRWRSRLGYDQGNRDGGGSRTLLSILLLETPIRERRCDVETRLLCAVPSSVSFSLGSGESYHSDSDSDCGYVTI